MTKTIVASVMPEESMMALIEDGELMEVSVERSESGHLVGNIYKGKVKNVLPGMQAAFVDIGRDKNAFLYLGEAFPRLSGKSATVDTITAGQDITIQIVKDAIGTKGPRATTHITLPGRYVVLMPSVDYIGISRRIASESERERLRILAEKVQPDGMGMIVRTVAEGHSEDELVRDIQYLEKLWNALNARAKRAQSPSLIYRDVDLVIRIVRDYLTDDVSEFIVDNSEAYGRVRDLLTYMSPEMAARIKLYEGQEDIFVHYGLAAELENMIKRKVWLKCGGYIVIDHTEALTVIDVNTGKFVGRTSLSDTVFHTNLEAAAEIARQMRLRDIGGIIIVDFIDMAEPAHKAAVLALLAEKFKQDRTRTNILGLTSLGLVEITRKKGRQNLNNTLYSECPYCEGRGRIQSPETVAINVRRQLRKNATGRRAAGRIVIQAHPRVAEILAQPNELARMEQELAHKITVESVSSMHPECYSLLADKE